METVTVQEKLSKISESINSQSYESRAFSYEETINAYLDLINTYRHRILNTTEKVSEINSGFESLSWIGEDENISDTILKDLNKTLISASGLIHLLKKDYSKLNSTLRGKGLCKVELNGYIDSIRNLAETLDDIDSVFFRLPKESKFQDHLSQLASLL